MGGRSSVIAGAALLVAASPLYAPQLLAFPHQVETPIGVVRSESPIAPEALDAAVAYTRARMATTPLAGPDERRPIFLTDGGWRWHWLAPGGVSAFGLTRPISRAVIINRANLAGDAAAGVPTNDRKRTLGSILAHEFTHGLVRRKYGVLRSVTFPRWKVEGYADHVAGESTLDAAAAARLEAAGADHPALIYYRGRQKVAAELAKNGGNVDALFLEN